MLGHCQSGDMWLYSHISCLNSHDCNMKGDITLMLTSSQPNKLHEQFEFYLNVLNVLMHMFSQAIHRIKSKSLENRKSLHYISNNVVVTVAAYIIWYIF